MQMTLTNEELLFLHVLRTDTIVRVLERKYYAFVVSMIVENNLVGEAIDEGWGEDCQAALWHFVEHDPFWREQCVRDQKRFVTLTAVKIAVNVELFFESFLP